MFVYVLNCDAVETKGFKWTNKYGLIGIRRVDAWFDEEVAAWAGRIVRLRLVEVFIDTDPDDSDGIEEAIAASWDLVRVAPTIRSYEHPAWFNASREFNASRKFNGVDP